MQQPTGFEACGKEGMICKLKTSLYDLKQALRQCYKKFDTFMRSSNSLGVMLITVVMCEVMIMVTFICSYM